MSETYLLSWDCINVLAFDFDGVFTNNKVYVDENGVESVCCDRGDGLAFDMLRKFVISKNWDLDVFIISTEKNPVVAKRAEKLRLKYVQAVSNKAEYIAEYAASRNISLSTVLYVGNDLNDLSAMSLSGISIAPCDAHPLIKKEATIVLDHKGGEGFVRVIIERLLGIKSMSNDEIIALL